MSSSSPEPVEHDPGTGGSRTQLVSVVSPVYCEEDGIEAFHARLVETLEHLDDGLSFEIIYVNDGSTDRSGALLRKLCVDEPRARLIDLSRNFGHQLAITAGVDHALGDAVVVIDSDLQDPPEVILEMVERWRAGSKVVYGVRTHRVGESRFKLLTARWFYRIINSLSDVQLPPDSGDFRLMDRAVVDVLCTMREENRYVRGMVAWIGFSQSSVEYERDPRHAGETKFTVRRMVRFASDAITSFSEKPLRMATQIGTTITLLALVVIVWVTVGQIVNPDDSVRGWPSLMAAVLFLGGVQLLCVGLLGAYIGRIYRESKGRPLYVVAEVVGTLDNQSGSP